MSLWIVASLIFLLVTVFHTPGTEGTHAFTPAGTLDILSEVSFTVLEHPEFSQYGVRIKKSGFCDGTVSSYTGYIDVQARHLFFYFFESRSDPDKDDVIFWTNGGPCRVVNAENGTVFHPESWNSNANVFFIDQPIGTGFSYAEYGETVSSTEEAAKDIAAFVAIFFAHFSKFQGRGFHMAGESFAGRYLPVFAAAVYDQNPRLVKAGLLPINLTSVMIGMYPSAPLRSSLTSPHRKRDDGRAYFVALMVRNAVLPSITPTSPGHQYRTCVQMKAQLPRCTKWIKESCQDQFDLINCAAALEFCTTSLLNPYMATGYNQYDLSKKCGASALCYDEIEEIAKYLNQKEVQALLGVDASVSTFSSCSADVSRGFDRTLDMMRGAAPYVGALLERGVRVLVYVGTYDWICNWRGNEAWTLALEWSGKAEFAGMPLREWVVDGRRAGRTRAAGGLTFATVDAAGHMVPYDKPKESLEMVNRWIAGNPLVQEHSNSERAEGLYEIPWRALTAR
ncbi:serine carboxypeptidase [Mycena epipterygia]|nr:serine carboxypeptidase [Mycena epipterygia]